ncbi:MAG: NFACT family protein [Oscillospiraceae bacterium]|nr:NFACT family protein [Oscillospiraceae bacterium]
MALDGAFLHIIRKELAELVGSRIEKIYQPSKDELMIGLRTRTGAVKLYISASASSARVNLTDRTVDNPMKPPMFCMLMRKRLGSGRLAAVRQDGLERILFLDFETVNELGDNVTVTLACEIMGHYSNIIAVDENGRIIDAIKRVGADLSGKRVILPGIEYEMPPRPERLNILECSREDIISAFEKKKEEGDMLLSKAVIGIFEGISPLVAREWVFRADGDGSSALLSADDDTISKLIDIISWTRDDINKKSHDFVVLQDGEGMLKDFCFTDINQYGSLMNVRHMPSAGKTLDLFYSERDSFARMKQRAGDMYKLLKNLTDRISRRLSVQRGELDTSENKEIYKLKGDLLSANMYRLEKGMGSIELENFYDENGGTIRIELDKRLTPSQNMQRYYSMYRKADTAVRILTEQITAGEEELAYVESVSDALSRAQGEDEINELRTELIGQGYIGSSSGKGKNKAVKARPPVYFTSPDGYRIAVGRNNIQNDILTLKTAEKTDIWLHTKDIPGSHVIIFTEKTAPPDSTIMFAARLAAYHSKAAASSQVPVDYVPVKLVRKPSGAKPGKVIFTGNRTLYVKPFDAEEIGAMLEAADSAKK